MTQAQAFTNIKTRITNPKTGIERIQHHPIHEETYFPQSKKIEKKDRV